MLIHSWQKSLLFGNPGKRRNVQALFKKFHDSSNFSDFQTTVIIELLSHTKFLLDEEKELEQCRREVIIRDNGDLSEGGVPDLEILQE